MNTPEDTAKGARAMELLPCPFCGCAMHMDRDPATEHFGPEGDHGKGCLIGSISFVDFADIKHAIREWNTRAGLAAMPDHSAELLEALEELLAAYVERYGSDPTQGRKGKATKAARAAIAKARAQKGGVS